MRRSLNLYRPPKKVIVYLANKSGFRDDFLSNRIGEIVHESFQGALGKSVGASELASWKHSLRQMDTLLEDSEISHVCARRPAFGS